jgi:hypothetical protein
MWKILGLLAVGAAIAAGCWFYMSNKKTVAAQRAESAADVRRDLRAFARAERAYKASHGTYASLDELYSSGALKEERPARDGYTYSSGSSSTGFSIIARCQAQPSNNCPSFEIDQSMELQQLP